MVKQKTSFWLKIFGVLVTSLLGIAGVKNADKISEAITVITTATEQIENATEEK